MLARFLLFLFLSLPWGYLVGAADYRWGHAFGYVIIPPLIWWLVRRFGQRVGARWVVFGLILSYVASRLLARSSGGEWDYFFKPLTLTGIVNVWTAVVVIGVWVAVISRKSFGKTCTSA